MPPGATLHESSHAGTAAEVFGRRALSAPIMASTLNELSEFDKALDNTGKTKLIVACEENVQQDDLPQFTCNPTPGERTDRPLPDDQSGCRGGEFQRH